MASLVSAYRDITSNPHPRVHFPPITPLQHKVFPAPSLKRFQYLTSPALAYQLALMDGSGARKNPLTFDI